MKEIIKKFRELCYLLDENLDDEISPVVWKKRKDLYDEIAALEAEQEKGTELHPVDLEQVMSVGQSEHRESKNPELKNATLFLKMHGIGTGTNISTGMTAGLMVEFAHQYAQQRMPTEEKEYPEKHKRVLNKEDCRCCNMRQTYFCKEYCLNALIER